MCEKLFELLNEIYFEMKSRFSQLKIELSELRIEIEDVSKKLKYMENTSKYKEETPLEAFETVYRMDDLAKKRDIINSKVYDIQDFLKMDDGTEMLEFISGEVYQVSIESDKHNNVVTNLKKVFEYQGEHLKVFITPEVWLKKNEIKVHPDIAVFCEEETAKVPNLIVEVFSNNSHNHDRLVKSMLYVEAGIQEYWLVNPSLMTIEIYYLMEGEYKQVAIYKGNECATSQIFPELEVCLQSLFGYNKM